MSKKDLKKLIWAGIIYAILFVSFIFATPYYDATVILGLFPICMFFRMLIFLVFIVHVWFVAFKIDLWWAKEEYASQTAGLQKEKAIS